MIGKLRIAILKNFLFYRLLSSRITVEKADLLGFSVIHALKVMSAADGPVNRAGSDSQYLLNFIQKGIRVSGLSIKLINEGKNGDMSHNTDFKELNGLGLHTLCSVNDHYRTVCRHQGSIGILREILVSRSIQNVNALSVIIKLEHGGGYGNSSFLLNLHPVGNRMLCGLSSLYRSCQVDGTSIEKKLLCKGGFSCVRVGNNRKGSSFFNFFS